MGYLPTQSASHRADHSRIFLSSWLQCRSHPGYLDNDKNLSQYSTTVILPCFSSQNSSLILLIKPGGTWVLLNLTLNSSQVIMWPPVIARTLFHHALASPAR